MAGGRLGGGGTEQKGKRTHGHGQQCGDCWGEGSIRRLNSKEKYNKYYIFKKENESEFYLYMVILSLFHIYLFFPHVSLGLVGGLSVLSGSHPCFPHRGVLPGTIN